MRGDVEQSWDTLDRLDLSWQRNAPPEVLDDETSQILEMTQTFGLEVEAVMSLKTYWCMKTLCGSTSLGRGPGRRAIETMKTSTLEDPQTGDTGDLVKLETTARRRPPHHSLQTEGAGAPRGRRASRRGAVMAPEGAAAAGGLQQDGQAATSAAAHIWAPPAVAGI